MPPVTLRGYQLNPWLATQLTAVTGDVSGSGIETHRVSLK